MQILRKLVILVFLLKFSGIAFASEARKFIPLSHPEFDELIKYVTLVREKNINQDHGFVYDYPLSEKACLKTNGEICTCRKEMLSVFTKLKNEGRLVSATIVIGSEKIGNWLFFSYK